MFSFRKDPIRRQLERKDVFKRKPKYVRYNHCVLTIEKPQVRLELKGMMNATFEDQFVLADLDIQVCNAASAYLLERSNANNFEIGRETFPAPKTYVSKNAESCKSMKSETTEHFHYRALYNKAIGPEAHL